MSSPPWFVRLAGRHLLPLLLSVFALLTISLRYQHQMGNIVNDVVQQESARLRDRLSIEQSQLDLRMGLDDTLVLRRLVGALALHQGLDRAFLIDPQGKVRASLSRLDLGQPITEVLSRSGAPVGLMALQSGPAPSAIVVSKQADGLALSGDVPLLGGHRLLVWVDNTRAVSVRRNVVEHELVSEAVLVLLAVAGLALLLHLLWFRRAQRLSLALEAIGSGDLDTRTGLQGRDELADIGKAADHMAEQLRREQERLRRMNDLVNRSPAVVIEWLNQSGWPVVQVSDSVRQWGYEPQQLLDAQVHYGDLLHPEDSARIHAEVAGYFVRGPDEYRQVYRIRRADGGWAWVDDRTSLSRGSDGEVARISGVLLDVTAQKQAQQAQREQAELLRMFYELPFLGMAISSPTDKRWLQVNDRLCEILRYSREELLSMSWAQMTPPGDLERNVELFNQLLAGQRDGYRLSKRFVRKDGSMVHTEIDVRAVRDAAGAVQRLFATIQDVSERMASEEALRRSEALLLRTQEIARVGSWSQDLVGGLFTWSPQTYVIHEVEPEDVVLTIDAIRSMVHPDDLERLTANYAHVIEAGEPFDVRYRLRMSDGRIKHLHVKGEFELKDGRALRSVGMVVDETALLEAQLERDRLVSVMENTSDIVCMGDPQGRALYLNRAASRVLGLPQDEPLDNVLGRFHPPWAAQRLLTEGVPAALREGRWLGESVVVDVQGREWPVSQLLMSHRGEDGKVDYLWTILRDISEIKAAEAALELERTQLAQAQEVAHVGSWTMFPADGRVAWSDEHYRVLGFDPQSVEPSLETFLSVVHPDDLQLVQAHLELGKQSRVSRVNRFEHRIVTSAGVRHLEERTRVDVDAQGMVVRIIGTTMDVTERVLAEQALREAKNMLEQAESVALVGSWAADAQTQRVTMSAQLFRNLGLVPADRPPSTEEFLACVHPDDQLMVARDMEQIRQGKEVETMVYRTSPDQGPVRVMRRTVLRITREDQGWKPRYIGTLQDITDAMRAEERLRQINQELELRVTERTTQLRQANQELEAFSYTVSHDLKAPLRGIDGYSQLLAEEYGDRLDADGREFVQRIRHGVQLMGELIKDLLEYSRMERRDMARDPVALVPLIQHVLDGYEADIRQLGAQVQIELEPFTLALDREGMAVVLRNLIGNALKFSRDSRPPRIVIGGRTESGRRILWVRDNGVGFDMKYHDRMFGIFQRLHRAEEFAGTGVGLALVAKAVQRMGGRVWAEGTPGAGASFFLEFPE